jgi:bacillithiol biosynthesis cysteine-adding enzyme BshC
MQSTCVRHTELPHPSRLFTDYLYGFDRVARFYAHSPYDAESYRRAAAQVNYPDERRAALVEALAEQNGGSPALDRLARPGTVAVVTGQQVGLFSGPCYTIYKALTAAKLARRLTEMGIPAVPVFWLATEDHDYAEVNHCWVFDAQNRPVRLEIPGSNPERRPVGEIPVDGGPLDALRETLRDFPFGEETSALVESAYANGRTFGAAFFHLLRQVLSSQDLLFLDPLHPAARRLAAPLLREAVEAAPDLTARVLERNRELTEAGYHAQVHLDEHTSLVFLLEGGRRLTLHRQNGEYSANSQRFSTGNLAARAEQLSPNALLRPVIQDYMLPTVAYVGGPAELAYLAQSQVIYDSLLRRMPVALHRQSATLLDVRSAKLMDRYGLGLPDFFEGEEMLRERMARKLVPPELGDAVARTQSKSRQALDELAAVLARFDPTLEAALENSRRRIVWQLSKIERKAAREALRRNERAAGGAAYLNGLIYPEKHLQERFYSILPFLARHGLDLAGRLSDMLTLDCPDHRVLVL